MRMETKFVKLRPVDRLNILQKWKGLARNLGDLGEAQFLGMMLTMKFLPW